MDLQTPVTLSVGSGVYLVSIIAARRGKGILDSTVGYTELQTVINGTDPVEITTTSVTTSKGGFQCRSELLIFFFNAGVSISVATRRHSNLSLGMSYVGCITSLYKGLCIGRLWSLFGGLLHCYLTLQA
jgi:hypothetical protein